MRSECLRHIQICKCVFVLINWFSCWLVSSNATTHQQQQQNTASTEEKKRQSKERFIIPLVPELCAMQFCSNSNCGTQHTRIQFNTLYNTKKRIEVKPEKNENAKQIYAFNKNIMKNKMYKNIRSMFTLPLTQYSFFANAVLQLVYETNFFCFPLRLPSLLPFSFLSLSHTVPLSRSLTHTHRMLQTETISHSAYETKRLTNRICSA